MYKYNKPPKNLEWFALLLNEYKCVMSIRITPNSIEIDNSLKLSKHDFEFIINQIREDLPYHPVVRKREPENVINEWATLKICHQIGLCKNTKFDIRCDEDSLMDLLYECVGPLCLLLTD